MTVIADRVDTAAQLEQAGLDRGEVAGWLDSRPPSAGDFDRDRRTFAAYRGTRASRLGRKCTGSEVDDAVIQQWLAAAALRPATWGQQ